MDLPAKADLEAKRMREIVFDTETTGFKPGSICQLSYIIDDGAAPAKGKNLFFSVGWVDPGASRVHGFTADTLASLSGGRKFADHADELIDDFSSASVLVAHNYDFDSKFLDAEFGRAGKSLRFAGAPLCTMKHFTPICKLPPARAGIGRGDYKYPSLPELIRFFGIGEAEISEFAASAFGLGDRLKSHDARFDSAATYLCYRAAKERGYLP
jgi:DNA polymerase-3 subunit epsilon